MANCNPRCSALGTDIYYEITEIDDYTGAAIGEVLEYTCASGEPPGETSGVEIVPADGMTLTPGMRGWAKLVQSTQCGDCYWKAVANESTSRVHFTIDYFDDMTSSAICTVRRRLCSMNSIPGLDYEGKIEVFDPAGCYFNEDAEQLAGRSGHAEWVKDEDALDAGCYWVVTGLCCP